MNRQTTMDTGTLSKKLSNLIEGWPVMIDLTGEIPCMPSGKHRWIVSEQKNVPD